MAIIVVDLMVCLGGACMGNGDFNQMTNYGYWWSSSEYTDNRTGFGFYLSCDYYSKAGVGTFYKNNGMSVRCLRD